jgi:hypothetical protein
VLALRGANAWQTAHPGAAGLDGVILLHPNLYLGPPEPGREAEFHPVVARSRLPVHVIQPEKSPWRFRLDALKPVLERGGAQVSVQFLPGVRPPRACRYHARGRAEPRSYRRARAIDSYVGVGGRQGGGPPATTPCCAWPAIQGQPGPPPLHLLDLRPAQVLPSCAGAWCW